MRGAVLAVALSLGGCASGPRPRVDTPMPVIVSQMVPVPCAPSRDVPAMPAQVGQDLNGDARHDADILAAAALDLRSALDRARALLLACIG